MISIIITIVVIVSSVHIGAGNVRIPSRYTVSDHCSCVCVSGRNHRFPFVKTAVTLENRPGTFYIIAHLKLINGFAAHVLFPSGRYTHIGY